MGHIALSNRPYQQLQQRLDAMNCGAPESPTFTRILELLYKPHEADIARRIPGIPTPVDVLARKLGVPEADLDRQLKDFARRGLILDLELNGRRYYALPPVVMGLFEFFFMRTGPDVPTTEVARLFEKYIAEEGDFTRELFSGQTQIMRSLVREEALPQDVTTGILDWERATRVVESATAVSVSLCTCRHKAEHLGKACDRPQMACLSLNFAAEHVARNGLGKAISKQDGLRILQESKDAGLAQSCDNVKQKPMCICNCCGCCCELCVAVKTFNIRNAVVSSNWIAAMDDSRCKGCGKCASACPFKVIDLVEKPANGRTRKVAVCEDELCLGCGVCYGACKTGAITMKPREQRVFTPETIFDRTVIMAIERGKLANLVFEDPQKLSHRAMRRILSVLERTSLFKAALAIKPLRSEFLKAAVKAAQAKTGEPAAMFEQAK